MNPRVRTVVFRSILNKLAAFQKATIRCCVRCRVPFGISRLLGLSFERARRPFPQCSEVLPFRAGGGPFPHPPMSKNNCRFAPADVTVHWMGSLLNPQNAIRISKFPLACKANFRGYGARPPNSPQRRVEDAPPYHFAQRFLGVARFTDLKLGSNWELATVELDIGNIGNNSTPSQ